MSIYYDEKYLFDPDHGFGIKCRLREDRLTDVVFYEDGALQAYTESPCIPEIRGLLQYAHWNPLRSRNKPRLDWSRILQESSCGFQLLSGGSLLINVTYGRKAATLEFTRTKYNLSMTCSCDDLHCIHPGIAARILQRRLSALKSTYIRSDAPVDKSLFLEPALEDSFNAGIKQDFSMESLGKIHELVAMLDAAKSPEYYWQFYEYLLDSHIDYNYDSQLLKSYEHLLFALFEDPGFRDAVLAYEPFSVVPSYEERQHRSNRASFKRSFLEYSKAVKELDEKGFFAESACKEFLLKYRDDLRGLLKYYAVGRETGLRSEDLPFLARIADEPDAEAQYCRLAAEKLDNLAYEPETIPVFHRLLSHLTLDDQIAVYSRMSHISLSLKEVKTLSREAQKKLIYNIPLTAESFSFILEDLLADQGSAEKGRYILSVLGKVIQTEDIRLKDAVVKKVSELADNRLLLSYVCRELSQRDKCLQNGVQNISPEAEMSTYFDLQYSVENLGNRFRVLFSVADPARPAEILLCVEEAGDQLRFSRNLFPSLSYSEEEVKRACLAGKEDSYRLEVEKTGDAVAESLFSQKHRSFAKGYRELCNTLKTEKVMLAESAKVGIDWQIIREQDASALSFRVGNARKYVIRDAAAFIDAFRNGLTVEYGKDLILSHDPDNLQESDAAMIRLLMAARHTRGSLSGRKSNRYITVNDSLMDSLIDLLEGRKISYNERPCLVRLQKQKLRLHISQDYVLSVSLEQGQELFSLVGKGYLVSPSADGNGLVLDRVEALSDEVALLELVWKNPAVSIKPILRDFRKNIYSRFFEMIDVDPSVSGDFRLSEVRLNSYFDFENGVITVFTKILKDERELQADQLTERLDQNKLEMLQNYLSALGFSEGRMENDSAVLSFFKMDFTRLKKLTNVYLSESLQKKELRSVGRPVVRVSYQSDLIRVFLEKSDFTESELEQIIRGVKAKKKYILLGDNRIIDLDSETARDFCETVEDFGMNPKDLYRKKTISMVTAIKAFAHEKCCKVDRYLQDMIEEIRSFKNADVPVPALSGTLRDYQREGYNWLSILSRYGMGGILADDMGLGKTIQIIALIKADSTQKPSLVVCPKSLVFNWASEFARFDGETPVQRIYGSEAQRADIISSINYGKKAVYITSYDSLRNDIGKYSGGFHFGILDEAQYIKNVNALKTKSVKELSVTHRFALTGTPIENSVVDLWSIFDYILPGYFEELSSFKNSDTAAIARKAAPFILRRVKDDVLDDLPPKYERILSAEMKSGQRKLYDALRMDAQKTLNEGGKAFDILPYLTRLRQVCVDPGMFVENYRDGSGKADMLRTLIPDYLHDGHRILIFSQFVKALESVRVLLDELGIPSYFLSGSTPARDRVDMMDAFNSGSSGTDVFLISLKAGGTGLNLTGADTVIHLDPWWNVAAENQASDRTHRIGQTRNVEVIKLIAENSIEQRVMELQEIKKDVIRQVISNDDGSVTSASLEDIAFVLQ